MIAIRIPASIFSSLLCLLLLARCSPSPSSANPGASYDAYRRQVVTQVNEYRATLALPPLVLDTSKSACSDMEAEQDALENAPHHAFGQCGESAQNECPGWGSLESIATGCLASMWAEGPGQPYSAHGHYINMTNANFTKISVGFYVKQANEVWALQNFY